MAQRYPGPTSWAAVLAAQGVSQSVGFACSVLVVRALEKEEYAVYTVAGVALGLMSQVSDLGTTNAILAMGGGVHSEPKALGRLVRTALRLRARLLGVAFGVGAATLTLLLSRSAVGPARIGLITFLVALTAYAHFHYGLWSVTARLVGRVTSLQLLDSGISLTRLILVALASTLGPTAPWVLAANSLPSLIGGRILDRWMSPSLGSEKADDAEIRRRLILLIRSQLPNTIFYALYGQIALLVLGILGGPTQVADAGALGRLAAVLAVFSGIMSNLVLPQFARSSRRPQLRAQYLTIIAWHLTASCSLLLVAWLSPETLLTVLGPRYMQLEDTLVWVLLASLVHSFVAMVWSMNAAKGWIKRVWLTIPCILLVQLCLAPTLDLTTVKGAVLFGALPLLGALVVLGELARRGLRAASP